MKFFNKYPALSRLGFVLLIAVVLAFLHLFNLAIVLVGAFQLWEFARSKPVGACYVISLTPSQEREFKQLMEEMGDTWGDVKTMLREFADVKNQLKNFDIKSFDELRGEVKKLRKNSVGGIGNSGVRWVNGVPFVTDDCAEALTAVFLLEADSIKALDKHIPDADRRNSVLNHARTVLGVQTRAALASTDIPLPTIYVPQIIELTYQFGAARAHATVFPLGAGTVNLPRLKAGEDNFQFLGAGTAGMSQPVPERKVAAQNVTFTANKAGGIIRIPSEIEVDTFAPLGQFLGRYVARQFAKLEDSTLFLGDGTATYAGITGVGPYCVANNAYLRQLAAGKTKVSDATINDFRAMRGLVNAAVLAGMSQTGRPQAAYYVNPTLESLLVTFNTIGTPLIYRPAQGDQPATLDGWPVYFNGVTAPNVGVAQPSSFLAFFGDLSYWYLGERGVPRIEVSREVYFATDELAMRALERIDVEAMAVDAMSALQTAAQ